MELLLLYDDVSILQHFLADVYLLLIELSNYEFVTKSFI